MAVSVPGRVFVDPYGGLVDLAHRVLRTPGRPEDSFSDDPLRMMRAARFAAQLGFTVAPEVVEAMTAMADRIGIISAERVRDELVKLVCAPHPRRGLELLVRTGLAERVLPELPALALERDEHHRHKDVYEHTLTVLEQAMGLEDRLPGGGPDFVPRFAALMHDVGKPRTRRFQPDGTVTFHHHDVVGAEARPAADEGAAVLQRRHRRRRRAGRAAPALPRLRLRGVDRLRGPALRPRRRRPAGAAAHADPGRLHDPQPAQGQRAAADLRRARGPDRGLAEAEELLAVRPDLDGNQIMALLGLGPGREVGEAYRFLMELRMDRGPLGPEEAEAELRSWWARTHGG